MLEIKTFKQAEEALMRYMPLVKKMTGRDMTLERMNPMMTALGNPERKLRAVHIAGTSGKTSTTYYITALLVAAGKKTGTTVSPHIDSIAERVQINGVPLDEKTFCAALTEFMQLIENVETTPTYFELMIAFAYWYFAKVNVDFAVIETGLGGMHDSTNILQRADKLCVITDIGYDHMDILGHTLPEIAVQKAGIIHKHNQVIMYQQSDEIMNVIKRRCNSMQSDLKIIKSITEPKSDLLASFQQHNWQLAHEVFKIISNQEMLPELSDEQLIESQNVQVPGRMDMVVINNKTVIMDGAHNSQKMRAFVTGIKNKFPGQTAALLLSLKSDKDYEEIFPMLKEISDDLIITSFSLSQDIPVRSANLDILEKAASKHFNDVKVIEDQDEAYKELLTKNNNLLIITGSFYLIGQLRRSHRELIHA